MNPGFRLQHFRLRLEPRGTLEMPARNKGNVIRGGLGSTFRRLVCHAGCREPEICELRAVCPYVAVFNPFVPAGSEKISKNRDIPRPFVIKPPLETKQAYGSNEVLSFDLVVVGKAVDYLPYFIVTFKELSRVGLGRGRTPCELVSVESISMNGGAGAVFDRADNMVRPAADNISWQDLVNGASPTLLKLNFLTPTSLRANGRIVRRPTFSDVIRRLRDRISALSYFYCGEALNVDFKGLGEDAAKVAVAKDNTHWVESSRYSRRREVAHDLSGFIGTVLFEGEIGPFLPYLTLGEYLHVGKNAVFGNGWFRIEQTE